jgi:hypothetical protein
VVPDAADPDALVEQVLAVERGGLLRHPALLAKGPRQSTC